MSICIGFYFNNEKILDVEIKGQTYLGRSRRNDIIIKDPKLSSVHCYLDFNSENRLYIMDMKSKNGIYFQGEKVHTHNILMDQKITLGNHFIMLEKEYITKEEIILYRNPETTPMPSKNEID